MTGGIGLMTDDSFLGAEEESYGEKTQAVGFVPLEVVESAKRTAAFICIRGRAVGESFSLEREETLIGRGPECDIRLEDEGISRRHCKVVRSDGEWVVMDLGSTNGTYQNSERIQVLTLTDGMKVHVGLGTILRFQHQDVMDERYQRSMYESKTRDPLTKAYNRGYFSEAIEREVAFAARHGAPLSLVMFDLDHFKRVNDTFGHQAGDYVLKSVARTVQDIVRQEDVFARYGGEEFALILRNTPPEKALILSERIRRSVEKLEIVHNGRRIPCTVSLGIAFTPGAASTPTSQQLIEQADERLYRAKDNGRNRTEVALFDD
jgi:diguanylate cyclase (GGDEF)-like protein